MKKATMVFSRIVMTVFTLVALLILGSITAMINGVALKTDYEASCKTSVAAFSKLAKTQKVFTLGTASGQADQKMVDCPTQYINFRKRTSKTDQTKAIADLMAQCYNIYGEGKIPLLPVSNEVFCGICSVIDFQDQTQILVGLPYYLMAFKSPYKIEGSYPTYFEYITKKKPDEALITKWKSSPAGNLEGTKRYAIIYLYLQFGGAKLAYEKMTSSPGNMLLGIASPTNFVFGQEMMGDIKTLVGKEGGAVALVEYNEESLKGLSCAAVPFSQLEKKYR